MMSVAVRLLSLQAGAALPAGKPEPLVSVSRALLLRVCFVSVGSSQARVST